MSTNAGLIKQQCLIAFGSQTNKAACNIMLASIASGCGVNTNGFLNNKNANLQTQTLISKAADAASGWEYLGQGDAGATVAVSRANAGYFVVAAWKTSGTHGHVAVANAGAAVNGWPRGTWGVFDHPEQADYDESLRMSFGSAQRPTTKFFACELP